MSRNKLEFPFKKKLSRYIRTFIFFLYRSRILRPLNALLGKNKNSVVFLSFPNFSGNPWALYNYLKEKHSSRFKLVWITHHNTSKQGVLSHFKYTFRGLWTLLRARYIVEDRYTEEVFFLGCPKKQILLNLWHGMPIKTIYFFTPADRKEYSKIKYYSRRKNAFLFATSELYRAILSAAFGANLDNVKLMGQPRNDGCLRHGMGQKVREKLFELKGKAYTTVILYAPTHFTPFKQSSKKQLFYLKGFEQEKFFGALEKMDVLFLCRTHPMETALLEPSLNTAHLHYGFLSDEALATMGLTIDETLSGVDLLITDYSSIFIDFLLLNRPIVFAKNYFESYQNERSFIFGENYHYFCPGPQVESQDELLHAIQSERTADTFRTNREKILKLFHTYSDGRACERIYKAFFNSNAKRHG